MCAMKPRVLVVDVDAALAEMLGFVMRNDGFEAAFVAEVTRAMSSFNSR